MIRENPKSFRSGIRAAIRTAGIDLRAEDEDKLITWIKDVFRKNDGELRHLQAKATPRLLRNLVVLWCFRFTTADARGLLKGGHQEASPIRDLIYLRRQEVVWLAAQYQQASLHFDALEDTLLSTPSLWECDLSGALAAPARPRPTPSTTTPLKIVRFIEDIRETEEFQEGAPDAICKLVERYIDVGALKIANDLLRQAFLQTDQHAGLWFQKARLLLAQSERQMKSASHYRLLEAESDALSAAESHWGTMAEQDEGQAVDLRRQVFDTCLEALRRLPDRKLYETSGRQWSAGYDSTRELRTNILVHVVREAGLRADPYRPFGGIEDRVWARLGRLSRWQPRVGTVVDEAECARLASEPLFSETKDAVLIAAYDELMADTLFSIRGNRAGLRLQALNFIRFIAPDCYPAEVARFVDDLRGLFAEEGCRFLGHFDAVPVAGEGHWRQVMAEHLDAVLDRSAQRELAAELHRKWVGWVEEMQSKALASMFIDEVRIHFVAGRWADAYRVAREGEEKGVLKRTDNLAAFVLWRTALAAAKAARDAGDDEAVEAIIARHLSDKAMVGLAEGHYQSAYEDEDHIPMATPLDGEGLDEFAAELR